MLSNKSGLFRLRTSFFIMSVLLVVSPSVLGEKVKCYCEDSGFTKGAGSSCPASVNGEKPVMECPSGWCHIVQASVIIPSADPKTKSARKSGSFSSKGCAPEPAKKEDSCRGSEQKGWIEERGVSASLKVCYCNSNLCNKELTEFSAVSRKAGSGLFAACFVLFSCFSSLTIFRN